MKVGRLRVLMQRYKFAGVIIVACYLGLHHLWSRHRRLLLLLSLALLGGVFLCRAMPISHPVQQKITPAIPPAQAKIELRKTPGKISIDAKPDYQGGDLPYRAHWGVYTVVVEEVQDEQDQERPEYPNRVRILDAQGIVQREIRTGAFITWIGLERMTGYTPEELHLRLWRGGNGASFTEVYFTQKGGLHNILIFDSLEENGWDVTDLNHDGIPEIIAQNTVLNDIGGEHVRGVWPVITILGWNGTRYVDVTSRYPSRSLQEAAKRREDILDALKSREEWREWADHEEITGYYANMLNIGRGGTARRWLKRHLPSSDWEWVREQDAELRRIIATAAQRRAHVSQEKMIEPEAVSNTGDPEIEID